MASFPWLALRAQNLRLACLLLLLEVAVLRVEGDQELAIRLAQRREDAFDLLLAEGFEKLADGQLARHHVRGRRCLVRERAVQLCERDLARARDAAENARNLLFGKA